MKNLWFYLSLILSIILVIASFKYAQEFRGYDAIGGEIFMLILPMLLVYKKIAYQERIIKRLKQYNKELARNIF